MADGIAVQTLATGAAVGAAVAPFMISPSPKRMLGDIQFDVVIEERHREEVEITEHPVEQGAPVTDHAYFRPAEVVLRAGSSLSAPPDIAGVGSPIGFIATRPATYLHDLYGKLQAIKNARQPFTVVTGKATYDNMLIRVLECMTDEHNENILSVTIWCRQIIYAVAQFSNALDSSNMSNPQATGTTINRGNIALVSAPNYNSVAYAPAAGGL